MEVTTENNILNYQNQDVGQIAHKQDVYECMIIKKRNT